MGGQTVQTRRWTREEYDRMIATGIFHPEERLELIEGEIIAMTPQGSGHATAVRLVEDALRTLFTSGWDVRVQMPLALDPESEPEPDIAVFTVRTGQRLAKPSASEINLLIEVAESSLVHDTTEKSALYAESGISEYWVVDLNSQTVLVHRGPKVARTWTTVTSHQRGEALRIAALPAIVLTVDEILP